MSGSQGPAFLDLTEADGSDGPTKVDRKRKSVFKETEIGQPFILWSVNKKQSHTRPDWEILLIAYSQKYECLVCQKTLPADIRLLPTHHESKLILNRYKVVCETCVPEKEKLIAVSASPNSKGRFYEAAERGWKCASCQDFLPPAFHLDHEIPKRLGSVNHNTELHPFCPNCHQLKSAMEATASHGGSMITADQLAKIWRTARKRCSSERAHPHPTPITPPPTPMALRAPLCPRPIPTALRVPLLESRWIEKKALNGPPAEKPKSAKPICAGPSVPLNASIVPLNASIVPLNASIVPLNTFTALNASTAPRDTLTAATTVADEVRDEVPMTRMIRGNVKWYCYTSERVAGLQNDEDYLVEHIIQHQIKRIIAKKIGKCDLKWETYNCFVKLLKAIEQKSVALPNDVTYASELNNRAVKKELESDLAVIASAMFGVVLQRAYDVETISLETILKKLTFVNNLNNQCEIIQALNLSIVFQQHPGLFQYRVDVKDMRGLEHMYIRELDSIKLQNPQVYATHFTPDPEIYVNRVPIARE